MAQTTWQFPVRALHWVIAIAVTFQQLTSLFMPYPGTQYLFPYHEYVGLLAGLAVLLLWLYSYAAYDLPVLLPWGKKGRRLVVAETLDLFRLRLPPGGHQAGLSSFIHGLGLLAATGCAYTGTMMFTLVPPWHKGTASDPMAFTHYALEHKFFGTLLWVYIAGHILFALIHQFSGDNVFGAIFSLARDKKEEERAGE